MLGNEEIISHFKNAIKGDKVSHAYIFNGEKGIGKKTLAKEFAIALQCETHSGEACMKCHSCLQALSENHPDIIWVKHEKPGSIGVEDVREQVINDMQIKPYSSRYKVYIIDEAFKLTPAAQNALLKTIEEPPEYGIVLFLTENVNVFLQTILSRCMILNLKPLKDDVIKKHLMSNYEIPDYQTEVATAFAGGNLGKAIFLASSERFNQLRNDVTHFLKYIEEMEAYEIVDAVKHLSDYKVEILDYMDLMIIWFRDILLYKATQDVNSLLFKEEYSFIKAQSIKLTYENIENILKGIEKAKVRLKANVNFDLALELMFLEIKDNII